jgi:hypothetical protein
VSTARRCWASSALHKTSFPHQVSRSHVVERWCEVGIYLWAWNKVPHMHDRGIISLTFRTFTRTIRASVLHSPSLSNVCSSCHVRNKPPAPWHVSFVFARHCPFGLQPSTVSSHRCTEVLQKTLMASALRRSAEGMVVCMHTLHCRAHCLK